MRHWLIAISLIRSYVAGLLSRAATRSLSDEAFFPMPRLDREVPLCMPTIPKLRFRPRVASLWDIKERCGEGERNPSLKGS